MEADALKAAEQRGYSKGYIAGRRRKMRDIDRKRQAAKREAFIERAFLAVLPWVFEQRGWGVNVDGVHRPYATQEERIDFAWRIARRSHDLRSFY